jgi:hypothetical protein
LDGGEVGVSLVLPGQPLPPAEITSAVEAETEIRRHQALLDVMRRGRADLREQILMLRRCVEYAYRGADLVDEMRAAGELVDEAGGKPSEVRTVSTLAEVGLTRQRVAEWRSLRDNGALGFLDQALADGREDTLRRASGINWLRERIERIAREEAAAASSPDPAYNFEFRHGDFRTALGDLAGTVDAIVTDPPYGADFLDEYDALGEVAAQLLTPTGLLVVMVGQTHLAQYLARLETHLVYRWTAAYLTDGPATRIHGARIGTKWKPVLLFDRGRNTRRFLTQDIFVSTRPEKTLEGQLDGWTQSETGMADIVEHLTAPGEFVVDPFMGVGTTAVACRHLGRRFVGCDIDPDAVRVTRERLQ